MIRMGLLLGIAAVAGGVAVAQVSLRAAVTRPDTVMWRAPPGATDGRERAVIYGDPDQGSAFWTYRVRTRAPIRVAPHTHPVDEYITVLEGSWFLGDGAQFDPSQLRELPPGSFIRIPAGTPHFVATGEGVTVIQSSGSGQFRTDFIPPH